MELSIHIPIPFGGLGSGAAAGLVLSLVPLPDCLSVEWPGFILKALEMLRYGIGSTCGMFHVSTGLNGHYTTYVLYLFVVIVILHRNCSVGLVVSEVCSGCL